jgi:hypothetical protein
MTIATILIFIGVAIYYLNFGWNLVYEVSVPFLAAAFFALLGFIILSRKRW